MSKRKRFVATSALLTLGFFGVQVLDETLRFGAIGALSIATIVLFAWSLREGLAKDMTLLSLVLPTLFTVGVGLFWFLLPANIFTRIPVLFLYGFGIYSLCLTMNIYTVSATRTIALLRAARGVGFVLTLITAFLLYDAVISLKANIFMMSGLVALVSYLLFLQGYWSIILEKTMSKTLLTMSVITSLIVFQVASILYFWPITVVVGSLFLTVTIYVLLGLGQARLEFRLFKATTREYILVGALVLVGMFFATRWVGY
jgi:hypothetical protein